MAKQRTLGKRRRRNTQYTRTKNKTKYFRKTRGGMRHSVGYSSLPVRNPPPPPPSPLPSPQPLPPPQLPPPPPPPPWSPYTLRRLPGYWRLPVRDPQLIPPPPPSPIPLPIPSSSFHPKGRDTPWHESWTP
jgi:hypothetical protein